MPDALGLGNNLGNNLTNLGNNLTNNIGYNLENLNDSLEHNIGIFLDELTGVEFRNTTQEGDGTYTLNFNAPYNQRFYATSSVQESSRYTRVHRDNTWSSMFGEWMSDKIKEAEEDAKFEEPDELIDEFLNEFRTKGDSDK